jgi:hypothetical protein
MEAPLIIAVAIKAAMRPYSTAVTADLSSMNLQNKDFITLFRFRL